MVFATQFFDRLANGTCAIGAYDGRGWRGFHHHAALSIAADRFLMADRIIADKPVAEKKLDRTQHAYGSGGLHPPRQSRARSVTWPRQSPACFID
jgi:SRSO17 transposase